MPYVLDYDSEGKVIGLKRVDELLTPNVATGASSTSPEQSLLQRVVNSSAEAHERVRNVAALRNVMNQSPGNQPAGRSVTNQSANDFIAMIANHFHDNTVARDAFVALLAEYRTGVLDETALYVALYRLFYEYRSLQLWPRLLDFFPPSWRKADLRWLHEAIRNEQDEPREVMTTTRKRKAPIQDEEDEPRELMTTIRQKKAPVGAFRSAGSHESMVQLKTQLKLESQRKLLSPLDSVPRPSKLSAPPNHFDDRPIPCSLSPLLKKQRIGAGIPDVEYDSGEESSTASTATVDR